MAIGLAIAVQDVVAAQSFSYDILGGGLLVSILGGLTWKRGTGFGAALSAAVAYVAGRGADLETAPVA